MKTLRLVLSGIAVIVPLSAQTIINGPSVHGVGVPYSAIRTTEHTRTLADGTEITQAGHRQMLYRDSAGRTRTEEIPRAARTGDQWVPVMVTIVDPVAGFRYQLNPRDRVGKRIAIGYRPAGLINAAQPPVRTVTGTAVTVYGVRTYANTTSQSLGTEVIEGVIADGTRTITVYPSESVGNDRQIIVTSEIWISRVHLDSAVLTKMSDPRDGETISKLVNLRFAEPNPALFVPPLDYTIQDASKLEQ